MAICGTTPSGAPPTARALYVTRLLVSQKCKKYRYQRDLTAIYGTGSGIAGMDRPSRIPSFVRPVQKRRRRAVAPAASGKSDASAGPASHHALWAVDRRACSPDGTTNARGV